MPSPKQTDTLNRMHAAVSELKEQLGVAAGLPHESMEDLKSAVDDVRFRLWGVLMAANKKDYQEFSERFRLRRATEICRGLVDDAAAGRMNLKHSEAAALGDAARELGRVIERMLAR
jgi:hypothetical protein